MPPARPDESVRGFFAYHLKQQREKAKLSQPALGQLLHVSGSLISGIETCTRTPGFRLCQAMDGVFGLDMFFECLHPRLIEETGLPASFPEFTDAEANATMVRLYENFVITGLFQTVDYARAVLRAGQRADKLEELVTARMDRQEILTREEPPMIVALLDEFAVRRWFGDRDIMRAQLEHLLELARRPNITIHIVPDRAQICPEGAFTILSFPTEPDVAYIESIGGWGRMIDTGTRVAELGVKFERIRSLTLSASDSEKLIQDILESL
ncbi:helix-turn-helix domain-containing protein [Actinomadura craniellae]|uniref:helix-turn-helix domain-containing protein n=1 Tax=Actinomadura craniellae TaxID=2231787 RepID=UPI001F269541|nr:helix-turn-helix transcriptional regulator [Actinomadura craniellae]